MKMGIIYKATNKITGESYIGQTTTKLKYRIGQHYNIENVNRNSKRTYHFMRVLQMFSKEDFEWTTLEENITKDNLNDREKYWVAFYDTYENGYNCNKGGKQAKISREYHLWHPEKGELKGDISFVQAQTLICKPSLINLYNDKLQTSKGWVMYKNKDVYKTFVLYKGKQPIKPYERKGYKKHIYEATNTKTGEILIGTSAYLSSILNVTDERIRQVANGEAEFILKIKEWRFKMHKIEYDKCGKKK